MQDYWDDGNIYVDNHPQIQQASFKFKTWMKKYTDSMCYCPVCKERFFEVKKSKRKERQAVS